MKDIGVYIIHNPDTDETYVGSGILSDRQRVHARTLGSGIHHNYRLQQAYNENPNFDFIPVPLDVPDSTPEEIRRLALEIEQSIIDEHKNNPLLLNIAKDVEKPRFGILDSPNTKNKKSQSQIKRWENMSEEEKHVAISNLTSRFEKGRKPTAEQIEKWAASREGYKHSDETKKKIGAANSRALKGRTLDPDVKEKVVAALLSSNSSRRVRVEIDGVIFNSLNDAARLYDINVGVVHHRVHSNNPEFAGWKLA